MSRRPTEAVLILSVRLPKELHHRLKVHCVERGVSVTDFVVAAIRDRLARARPSEHAK